MEKVKQFAPLNYIFLYAMALFSGLKKKTLKNETFDKMFCPYLTGFN